MKFRVILRFVFFDYLQSSWINTDFLQQIYKCFSRKNYYSKCQKSFKLCTLWEIKIDQPITILYHIWYHVILKEKYCIFYVTISQVPIVLCQKSLIFNICVSVCECVHMCVEPTEARRAHVCLSVSAHARGTNRGRKSPLDPLELELQMLTGPVLWGCCGRRDVNSSLVEQAPLTTVPSCRVDQFTAFDWSALTSGFCCRQSCISQAIWASKFLKIPWQQLNHGSFRCSWGVVDFF